MDWYEEQSKRASELKMQISKTKAADKIIGHFIRQLRDMDDTVPEFDENLWGRYGGEHNGSHKGRCDGNLQRQVLSEDLSKEKAR